MVQIRSRISSVKAVSLFTLSNIANSVIIFVSLGFYLKFLPPDEYGKAIFFSILVSLFTPLITMNSGSFFWTVFFDHSEQSRSQVYSTVYIFSFLSTLVFTGLVLILPESTVLPVNLGLLFVAVPLASFFAILTEDVKTLFIYQKKYSSYIFFNNGITLIENLLIILLVRNYSPSFYSRIYAWLAVLVMAFIFHFFVFSKRNKYLHLYFSKKHLTAAIRFGAPLMFQQWSKMALNAADRWFLAGLIKDGGYQMGVYNFGYQIGSIVSTFISGYINFLTPNLYSALSQKNLKSFHRLKKLFFGFLLFLVAGVIILYIGFLLVAKQIWGAKYYDSAPFILFAGLSTIIFAITIPYTSALSYIRKTQFLAFSSIATLIVNLLLNYLLISRYLTFGAAYATLLSYSFLLLLTYYLYKKIYVQNYIASSNLKSVSEANA